MDEITEYLEQTKKFDCPYCGKVVKIDNLSDYMDSDCIEEDRGMGAEYEHSVSDCEIECPKCKKDFEIVGSVYEYPEGAFNYETLEAKPI